MYLVTEQAQECEELASRIFNMFLEKNLIIKKEDGVYEPNPCKGIPDTQTLINYSRVLVDLQQLDEAQVIIELAIRMTDEDPVLIHELAWIYNLKGEYYDTVQLLQKSRALYIKAGCSEHDEVVQNIDEKLKQFPQEYFETE